jgi:hypothetical protein
MKDSDEKILERAKKRFEETSSYEAESRRMQEDDAKFRAGNPDNGWQWPDAIRKSRETAAGGARPCLTSNRVDQHAIQIENDIRQNHPGLKFVPADDAASQETAEMLNDYVRRIQYVSDADTAYSTALSWAVTSGVGYVRVLTEYQDDGFDQEVKIAAVPNMFSVDMDHRATDPAAADARYAFVTEWMTRDEFKSRYKNEEPASWDDVVRSDTRVSWYQEDSVRVVEYWEKSDEADKMCQYADGTACYASQDDGMHGAMVAERPQSRIVVTCYTLCGHKVLDSAVWPGKFIPIARVIGHEHVVEGKTYYSGLIRNAKDAQRMINYWETQEAEMLALAPKAPFVGASGQFDGFERAWSQANQSNVAWLEYNPVVDTAMGQVQVAAPQRQMPPQISSAIYQAKAGAVDDLKSVTGIFDASLGRQGNETSGRAIVARQKQGDTSSYHYRDNLSKCIRHVGRIILDALAVILDTPRSMTLMGEDGQPSMARMDPDMPMAYRDMGGMAAHNPRIGKYDVMAVTGQSYSTKRQEAAEGMIALTQANPNLWPMVGDILVQSLDWPGADEMAKRLRAAVPPQILGEQGQQQGQAQAQDPRLQMAMGQIEKLTAALNQAHDQLSQAAGEKGGDDAKLAIEAQKLEIARFEAETERMTAMHAIEKDRHSMAMVMAPAATDQGVALGMEQWR